MDSFLVVGFESLLCGCLELVQEIGLPVLTQSPGVDGDDVKADFGVDFLFVFGATIIGFIACAAVILYVGSEFWEVIVGVPDCCFVLILDQDALFILELDSVFVEEVGDFSFAVGFECVCFCRLDFSFEVFFFHFISLPALRRVW